MKTIRKSNILGIGYFSLPQVQGAPPLKGQAPYDRIQHSESTATQDALFRQKAYEYVS